MRTILIALLLTCTPIVAALAQNALKQLIGNWFFADAGSGTLLQLRADHTFSIVMLRFAQDETGKPRIISRKTECEGKWDIRDDHILMKASKGGYSSPDGVVKDEKKGYKFKLTDQKINGRIYQGLQLDFMQNMPLQRIGADTMKELGVK